jgi:hypothetical protein
MCPPARDLGEAVVEQRRQDFAVEFARAHRTDA